MGKKVTYERWINLFLPDGWNEREEMGFVLLEKENWPGMVQLTFIERDEIALPPAEAARILLEDTLEERDVLFPRDAIRTESQTDTGTAVIDYMDTESKDPAHWRIWFLVDRTRAIMAAYICEPAYDGQQLEEASRIIADLEFIPGTND